MIGLQLVIAGYQLPARYLWVREKEMAMCLLPIMTMMWLATTLCVLATTPKLTILPALVIAACVTCTDPVLSQAIAKGPFADMFVARPLREIISSEAGANDGFGFPFLMIAVYMMRHAHDIGEDGGTSNQIELLPAEGVGRLGGGIGVALKEWFLETWLYMILLSVLYGAVIGFGSCKAIRFCLKKYAFQRTQLNTTNGLGNGSTMNPISSSHLRWGCSLSVLAAQSGPTTLWPASWPAVLSTGMTTISKKLSGAMTK